MKHVGMFEAKTNLSSLVEEVEKGGEVVITRHGKPVARLVQMNHAERSVHPRADCASVGEALEESAEIADTLDDQR